MRGANEPVVCPQGRGPVMSIRILRRPPQFRQVYREGTRIVSKHAVVIYREVDDNTGPHFGFVASKRVGGAVQRNRAKRLLRAVVRQNIDQFQRRDLWVVLVARSGILESNYEDILRDLKRIMIDEGLIRDTSS